MYLFEFPHGIHGDGTVRYQALLHLLETGRSQPILYSYVHPIASAPLLVFSHLYKDGFWWLSRFNAFLFLGTTWYAMRRLRALWDEDSARRFALLMLAATMFPVHTQDYYSETFTACLAFLSLLEFHVRRDPLAIALLVLATWNTPGTALGSALLFGYYALRTRRLRFLCAIALLPAGIVAENFWKFGTFFPSAYVESHGLGNYLPYSALPGFSYPLFFGVLSVLLSFGKGLLFFVPGLLALFCRKIWDRDRELLWPAFVYLAGLVLVFSRWWGWYGGWFWGPRFFLFGSILGALALASLWRVPDLSAPWRWFRLTATTLSVWVGCQGVLYGQDFLEDCYARDPKLEFLCHYVPEYSPLWRVFVAQPLPHGRKWAYLAYFLLVGVTLTLTALGSLGEHARAYVASRWRAYGWNAGWRL